MTYDVRIASYSSLVTSGPKHAPVPCPVIREHLRFRGTRWDPEAVRVVFPWNGRWAYINGLSFAVPIPLDEQES